MKQLGETWTLAPPERPDAVIQIVNPKDPAIIIVNSSRVVLKDPRYNLVLWDLDRPAEQGIYQSLRVLIPSFKDEWLRQSAGFGPYPLFEQSSAPKEGSRLFGYVKATCPECCRERAYWLNVIYKESGWFSALSENETPNNKFLAVLFGKPPQEQEALIGTIHDRVNIVDAH